MPGLIPPWINKVNFIANYFWQGCEAPFELFVEFAGPPAGRAVALIIDLGMEDIVKSFFRPAGLRSHRHGRKGPAGRKKIPDLPDPNDEVAKMLPYRKEVAGRPFGSPTRWAFEISDVADRVAFNIAIVDVVSDTIYQALLGIIEVGESGCWWMRRGKATDAWGINIGLRDQWLALDVPTAVYEKGVEMLYAGAVPGIGGRFLVTLDADMYQGGPWTSTSQIGIFNATTNEFLDQSDEFVLEPGQSHRASLSANVPGGTVVTWLIRNKGEHLWTRSATAQLLQFGR